MFVFLKYIISNRKILGEYNSYLGKQIVEASYEKNITELGGFSYIETKEMYIRK